VVRRLAGGDRNRINTLRGGKSSAADRIEEHLVAPATLVPRNVLAKAARCLWHNRTPQRSADCWASLHRPLATQFWLERRKPVESNGLAPEIPAENVGRHPTQFVVHAVMALLASLQITEIPSWTFLTYRKPTTHVYTNQN
jgi:hypothetical protein